MSLVWTSFKSNIKSNKIRQDKIIQELLPCDHYLKEQIDYKINNYHSV